uniref:Nuclear cap-binding protein subunit 3 n=1 Tax=Amblyomma aureolatum TaxID=187763 RepID=A0A1E1X5X9_9ACAR
MADFLLERELPNLKVAVDSNTLEADNDDCMDLDESSKVEKGADITESPQQVIVPARVADRARKSSDEMAADDGDDPEAYMVQFAEVYRSLGVDPRRPGGTRLNAVHVRGVTDMGTEDVLEYFKEYDPSSIDWINDYACNVVWQRNQDVARALQELSRPLLVKPKARGDGGDSPTAEGKPPPSCVSPLNRPEQAATSRSIVRQESAEGGGGDGSEEVVVMSDDEFCDDAGVSGTPAPKGPVPDREVLDISEVGVPVPPGEWRRAIVPHPKAKILLMRFSNKYDKKMPGAEKHSEYYKKYGNPNYGGMTGLISNSRKRRMREGKSASFALGSARSMDTGDDSDRDRSLLGARQRAVKRMRMRMYADEEEEKQRRGKRPGALGTPTPPTPWSTPGNSPTSDEETFTRSLSTSVSGSSVWDRLSGGRANLFTKRHEHEDDDEYGADDRDRFPLPRRSRYVDLDDPSLRDDYDPAEDGYGNSSYGHDFVFDERSGHGSRRSSRGRRDDDDDEGDDEDAHRLLSTVRMAGTDLRSKLEKLRQSRTAPERMNPLRISVSNEAP